MLPVQYPCPFRTAGAAPRSVGPDPENLGDVATLAGQDGLPDGQADDRGATARGGAGQPASVGRCGAPGPSADDGESAEGSRMMMAGGATALGPTVAGSGRRSAGSAEPGAQPPAGPPGPAAGPDSGPVAGPAEIRPLEPAERAALMRVFETALVSIPSLPFFAEDQTGAAYFHEGRQFGAFVDGQLVGSTDSLASWLAVPGGRRLPHAAVTRVGVLPTHTRRGLLTALMRAQLTDARTRGDVVATLRASEAVIYERFGYGVATRAVTGEVLRSRARLRPTVAGAHGPVRLLDPSADSTWELLARVYESAAHQPGAIGRSERWWNIRRLRAAVEAGNEHYIAVHGAPGAEDGFVRYQPEAPQGWRHREDRAVDVHDFVVGSQQARAGLLRYLLGVDLVTRLNFELPFDDPLPFMLTDQRAMKITATEDETWLRLLDVPAALAARTYRDGVGAVTIEVVDELLADNSGCYEVSGSGAARLPDAPATGADLQTDVATLGAAYLGGTRWWQLAAAGRVQARDQAALTRADELFRVDPLPYAGTPF